MSYKDKPRAQWGPKDHAERNRDIFDLEARLKGYVPVSEGSSDPKEVKLLKSQIDSLVTDLEKANEKIAELQAVIDANSESEGNKE